MAVNDRKRQKKLERQKAKRKAERRELARRESGGLPARLAQAASAPILHCCTTSEIWEQGIGQVLISRELRNGDVAFVVFLLDIYCLGVKDVIMDVAPRPRYELKLYDKLARRDALVPLKPECLRKLVEGAVAYALDLGLAPYPDYSTAKLIFGDIRVEECAQEFEYGKDGKPFFVAGPHDSPAKCLRVVRSLEERCGSDGYHYILPVTESMDFSTDESDPDSWT
jgi:hypothetical protein